MTSALDHFQSGDLSAAIAQAITEVKTNPTQIALRIRLAQLLFFAGDFERADRQLDMAASQDPTWGPKTALMRQLARSAVARHEFYSVGRPPELLSEAGETTACLLKAAIALREGALGDVTELLAQAEAARPALTGTCNGETFEDFRDLNDFTAGILEVLTTNGKYYWVDMANVRSIEFAKPESLTESLWRKVDLDINEGPQGAVYIPATYWTPADKLDDSARLGRSTDWQEGEGDFVLGVGQRSFLIDDRSVPISEFVLIEFDC